MTEEGYIYPRGFASKFNVGRLLNQVIPTGVFTVVEWDFEYFDLLDEMLIVNPWTFTPKQAGYYFLHTHCTIYDLAALSRFNVYFFLNGAAGIAGAISEVTNLAADITKGISAIRFLTPTDAVDVRVQHTSGINRNLTGNINETLFCGYRIG